MSGYILISLLLRFQEYIESLRAQLPELPHDKAERLVVEVGDCVVSLALHASPG